MTRPASRATARFVRLATITGWILLAAEVFVVGALFITRNMGDDAAGRGMARGFAIVLAPVVAVAAGLFIWGQRGGPRGAFWIGFGVLALPLALFAVNAARSTLRSASISAGKALNGKFDDARLTTLARAIEGNDTAKVRAMLGEGRIDFDARSRRGRTILGRAIEHALEYGSPPSAVESVRMLLAAGAKPIPNAVEPEFYQGNLDAHRLVAFVFGYTGDNMLQILDLILAAGADPNTRNYEEQPLYFSTYSSLAKLQVLARHGADFTALESTRTDRNGWTGAMFAVELGEYDVAAFLLDHGVSAQHVAPDGSSLRSLLQAKADAGESGAAFDALCVRAGVSRPKAAR